MAAISEIGALWMEGAVRTLDAMRTGFGASMADPPPATPSEVLHESGLVRLRHYEPREPAYRTPLLLIYSLVKRPFILDLAPGRSAVEYLAQRGFDVYLIDWIPPLAGDRERGFDAYVNEDIAGAVRAVRIFSGAAQVSILGYSMGGLLALLYTALHQDRVKNLVALTSPFQTGARNLPVNYLTAFTARSARSLVETYGNVPAWIFFSSYGAMEPAYHLLGRFIDAYRNSADPEYPEIFRRFEAWLHSDVPMAGRIFLETDQLWRDNALAKGAMRIGGRAVDLANITCPLLNVIGTLDELVNRSSNEPLVEAVSSADARNLRFPTTHLGAAVSKDSLQRLWPRIAGWLAAHDNG